jgi:hypothetical protein
MLFISTCHPWSKKSYIYSHITVGMAKLDYTLYSNLSNWYNSCLLADDVQIILNNLATDRYLSDLTKLMLFISTCQLLVQGWASCLYHCGHVRTWLLVVICPIYKYCYLLAPFISRSTDELLAHHCGHGTAWLRSFSSLWNFTWSLLTHGQVWSFSNLHPFIIKLIISHLLFAGICKLTRF